jgi:hypothetical protein
LVNACQIKQIVVLPEGQCAICIGRHRVVGIEENKRI